MKDLTDNHTFCSHLTAIQLQSPHVILIMGKVRLGLNLGRGATAIILGRVLQLEWAAGPSAAAVTQLQSVHVIYKGG